MVKLSQLPSDTAPTVTDKIPTYDIESNTDKLPLISALITLFFDNVPADSIPASGIDFASDSGDAEGGIWWEEIGRTTLAIAGDTITVSSIPARKYLRIIVFTIASGSIRTSVRFNNDSGSNYDYRISDNGGADATGSDSAIGVTSATGSINQYATLDAINVATQKKLVIGHGFDDNTAGSAPSRREVIFKWTNTSDQITRVDAINTSTGDFAIGSEVIVLGHN